MLSRNSKTKSHGGVCHHLPATKGLNRILTDQEFMPPEYYTSYVPFITSVSKTCLEPAGSAFYKANRKRKSLQPIAYGLQLIICFMLFNLSDAWAQSSDNREAAERQEEIKPLQIGDTIPEELWNMPLQVVNHPEGKDTITLNDYRDKKLIILDFWATWCGPCINALHKLDSIESEFEADVLILPSSTEKIDLVKDKFEKEGFSLMTAVEQIPLRKYFPCQFLPHQVWISGNRLYITTDGEGNPRESIQHFMRGERPNLTMKDDIFFEPFTFIDKYATERNAPLIAKSIVTGYINGLGNSSRRNNDSLQTYHFFNRPVVEMLRNIVKFPYNRILLSEMQDTKWLVNKEFDNNYRYCYQLFADVAAPEQVIRKKMLSDLSLAFDLDITIHQKLMSCYVLSPITEDIKIKTQAVGYPLKSLIAMLNYSVEWHADLDIFLDETDEEYYLPEKPLNETIDIWRKDPHKLKNVLRQIGLKMSKQDRDIEVMTVSVGSRPEQKIVFTQKNVGHE